MAVSMGNQRLSNSPVICCLISQHQIIALNEQINFHLFFNHLDGTKVHNANREYVPV